MAFWKVFSEATLQRPLGSNFFLVAHSIAVPPPPPTETGAACACLLAVRDGLV
ncbi:hypothetical protein GGR39_001303 [Novosphingobium fluoreni]|uniref:Uncharacterized protein n=1 Tax=Novosphingobium fluoreni TaxID=1391222 RepID=A0A7W6FXV7_9SPHN|nr:hypothetical protein [Novosphingobium fluoreni]